MTETPFGLVCEQRGATVGSVNEFAKADFAMFRQLFHYDFSVLEKELELNLRIFKSLLRH